MKITDASRNPSSLEAIFDKRLMCLRRLTRCRNPSSLEAIFD